MRGPFAEPEPVPLGILAVRALDVLRFLLRSVVVVARLKDRTLGEMRPRRVLLQDLQEQIAMRNMLGLKSSEDHQGRHRPLGVVAVAVELRDAPLLIQDVPLAIGYGLLGRRIEAQPEQSQRSPST